MARFVGAISGTSIDGLDLALVNIDVNADVSIVAGTTVPLPADLRETLKALAHGMEDGMSDDVDTVGTADATLGQFIGESINAFMANIGIDPSDVTAIGSHGQTIRHRPNADPAFTVQIGDPHRIAEITGIDTVADFRRRDMAAGGQGAPLVPLFHEALFRTVEEGRMVLNIGGIANVSILGGGKVLGFDTGPGNALIDAWCLREKGQAFDRDGAWARGGNIDAPLLGRLLEDAYLAEAPPKSTGKERYRLSYIERAIGDMEQTTGGTTIEPQDVQATLTEFTAISIGQALERWGPTSGSLIVCGGGRLNTTLMQRLEHALPVFRVMTIDALGHDGDAIEAAAFAWLASRTLGGQPGNAPEVTGATGARVLGAIYPGRVKT